DLGMRPGDVLEKLEGLSLGDDGTMKIYCDVIQSHDPSDKLAVQVLRFKEDARLRGEINGDELAPFESLGLAVQEETGDSLQNTGEVYTEYVSISDDTGTISVEVPTSWGQVDGSSVTFDDGSSLPRVVAAPDLPAFMGAW